MDKISIIIRCYNEETHIGRLLNGIVQQRLFNEDKVEIILVDSGSTDMTVAIASRYPVKILTIKPEEFTFGRSLNIGCASATGEVLVMASAHVYPLYDDWLDNLLAPFNNEKVGLSYGRQVGNNQTKFSEHQIFAQWFPSESNFMQLHPFCNNANAAIRKSLWENYQYDETLTGLEDIEMAKRILDDSFQLAYAADAEIVHIHEETPQRIYNRYRREALAMKSIFPEQKFGIMDFMKFFWMNLFSDYYHAFFERCFLKNFREIFSFRLMQFWGTYKGFSQNVNLTQQLRQTLYYPRELNRTNHGSTQKRRKLLEYEKNLSPTFVRSHLE